MRVSLPSPSSLDLWDSFITLIGNGQGSCVKVLCDKKLRLENELGINIRVTMVRFCDFKKFSTSSQNYGLRPGNATVLVMKRENWNN